MSDSDKSKTIETPWGPLGYITYKRTYSRRLKENDVNSPTEEFEDTINRVVQGAMKQLKVPFTEEEAQRFKEIQLQLKGTVAGRFLWQLGTKTVDTLGLPSLQNCALTVVDHPITPFTWAFDMLMLGSGVGYNIQREYVYKLPKVLKKKIKIERLDTKDADFIIPDSREGWVKLLGKVLKAYFYSGEGFSYSTICIRGKGTPIKGFGGQASGPEELVIGIDNICKVLDSRRGKQLRPIDCLDIMNIIGSIVVSGNVRRCLPENAFVHTDRGLVKIADVRPGQDKALTSEGYHLIKNKFNQGRQNLIKINTQDGEFQCTPNHKMKVLTQNGYEWVEAGNLQPGDRLISPRIRTEGVPTKLPEWNYKKPLNSTTCKDIIVPDLDEDMAWFLGMFQADGYTYPNYEKNGFNAYVSIVVGEHELEIAQKVQEQLKRFGSDLNVTLNKRKNEKSYIIHCQSKQLAWYLHENIKQANKTIRVPKEILEATPDIRLSFVAGVADGDGCLHNKPIQVLTTVYPEFAQDIQNILYSCGIESRLVSQEGEINSRLGWQRTYQVNLITLHSQNEFSKIPQLMKAVKSNSKSQNANGIPSKWVTDSKLVRKYGLYQSNQLNFDSYEKEYGKSKFVPTEVINIVEGNENVLTYDIEVENVHEFYCNGYLTHNSAQIAIGDFDDLDFLSAKDWSKGNIPNWRAMSNNSVVCNDFSKLPDIFWEGYLGNGEPYGLINLKLSQSVGRAGDFKYPDPDVLGFNPSLRAGTRIHTSKGLIPIEELQDKTFVTKNLRNEPVEARCWLSGKNKELWRITLENNKEYYCTSEHKWAIHTPQGYVKAETTDLKPGHLLPIIRNTELFYGSKGDYEDGFLVGWLYGDGNITIRSDNNKWQYNVVVGKKDVDSNIDQLILNKLRSITNSPLNWVKRESTLELSSTNQKLHEFFRQFGVEKKSEGLPKSIWTDCSESFRKGFIDAIFSADGCIDKSYKSARICISQSNKKLIDDLSELLGFYGVKHSIKYRKSSKASFPNNKIYERDYHIWTLQISQRENIAHFKKCFKLSHKMKQDNLEQISIYKGNQVLHNNHYSIKKVEKTTIQEDVWDVNVLDDTHCFQLAYSITGNCAEQSLAPYETCVTGDTKIQTEKGIFNIKDLVGKSVKIFNGEEWSEVTPFIANPKDTFLKINFSDGSYVKTTRYHEFSVSTPSNKKVFKKLRADQLENGMYLPKFELSEVVGSRDENAYTLGIFAGDGYLDGEYPYICSVEDYKDVIFSNCNILSENKMWKSEDRLKYMYRARISKGDYRKEMWSELRDSDFGLSTEILSLDKESSLNFLAGWIDSDGSIRNKDSNSEGFIITGSELKIRDAQLLCRRAGINYASIWRLSKKGEVTNYGTRNRDIWVLQIPSFECREIPTKLKEIKNFGDRYKINNSHPEGNTIDSAPRQRIISIQVLEDEEPSYCFSEPKKHMGVFGNVLTYQCCLAEIHLQNIKSKEELKEVATYLYRVNKHSLAIKCHQKLTEEIVHKNMRMGIGITGYAMATEEQKTWLPEVYEYLREYDKEYSKLHGFPESIKITTVKPSGTLSLLSHATPGAHPGYSHYFIRRIRMSSTIPLVETCRKNGYYVEYVKNFDGTDDKNTVVVEFPCSFPENTKVAKDTTAIDQLETIKELQSNWSDNSVSVTIYYRKEELEDIKKWLKENYNNNIKSVSFLLHSEHGFKQAPYEEISKEKYLELIKNVKPITNVEISEDSIDGSQIGCESGVCPIK